MKSKYRYQVVATDVDAGDSLSYGLINGGGATGLAINPTTGLVIWDSPTLGTYQTLLSNCHVIIFISFLVSLIAIPKMATPKRFRGLRRFAWRVDIY
ncbi:hypothetical protein [Pseudanabaena sp. UWO310]|uniref:hypothetical protein n=1 Tax=Pseudanabaena sp. UWO310 TaxID=2480795 RepID=UPI00115B8267|nr:hypothetical protein [Pseudanabaena sp. UWO310]TYQ27270.1 hypothetical protein PseudUWO310_16070 [Pseudanabaena sp. UWO310]